MEEEIVQNLKWSREIADRLTVLSEGSEDLSIYRVPSELRKVKEDAYNPRVVSIGPLHRDNPNLIAMKEHKWRCMFFILQLTNDFEEKNNYKDTIYELGTSLLKREVRASYAEDLTKIKVGDLVEIMLVDGCFMLALFLRHGHHCLDIPLDQIFNTAWMIPALKHDLALLENQIPFFILEILYDIIKPHIPHTPHTVEYKPPNSVTSLALNFFQPMNQKAIEEDTNTADCKHLLHLLHNFFLPRSGHIVELDPAKASNQHARKEDTETANSKHLLQCLDKFLLPAKESKKKGKFKDCASDLYDAGIKFEKAEDNLLCIIFENGTIKIPQVFIDDTTDSLFRNLIAFEQCHLKSSHHITSYVILMNSLIRSKEDIKLLKRKEIINENFAGGECVVHFESILDHVNPKDFFFQHLCNEVNDYSTSWFHWRRFKVFWMVRLQRYMRSLYGTYFSSPWSITAFLAAAVIFGLTVTQTYYAIHPH